jgi:hypothetical protein
MLQTSGATAPSMSVRASPLHIGLPAVASLVAALTVAAGPGGAAAEPLSLFGKEDMAQRHCRGDAVVWLDFQARRYFVPGQRRYGQGSKGTYACRREARGNGYRRSLQGRW